MTAKPVERASTPGYLTTEFWLAVLGVVALTVLTVADKVEGSWTAGAIAAVCLGYGGSRAVVKKALTP